MDTVIALARGNVTTSPPALAVNAVDINLKMRTTIDSKLAVVIVVIVNLRYSVLLEEQHKYREERSLCLW